jgi:hypothetical protein
VADSSPVLEVPRPARISACGSDISQMGQLEWGGFTAVKVVPLLFRVFVTSVRTRSQRVPQLRWRSGESCSTASPPDACISPPSLDCNECRGASPRTARRCVGAPSSRFVGGAGSGTLRLRSGQALEAVPFPFVHRGGKSSCAGVRGSHPPAQNAGRMGHPLFSCVQRVLNQLCRSLRNSPPKPKSGLNGAPSVNLTKSDCVQRSFISERRCDWRSLVGRSGARLRGRFRSGTYGGGWKGRL